MKRILTYAAISMLSLSFAACKKDNGGNDKPQEPSKASFYNPVFSKWNFADPTVWQGDDGKYYATGTHLKDLMYSSDLVNWEWQSAAIAQSTRDEINAYYTDFYAPDVVRIAGKRLMYVCCINPGKNSAVGLFAENESKPGVFDFVKYLKTTDFGGPSDSSDPEVVVDGNGKVWLFYGSNAGIWRGELTADGMDIKEGTNFVMVAGTKAVSGGSRTKVYEGCYLYQKDGWWYLFASSGHYNQNNYSLVCGRSKTVDGVFTDRNGNAMTDALADKILYSDEGDYFWGPGHCGEIFTDNQGNDFIFYHCHNSSNPGSASYTPRFLMLQQIFWDNEGWPYFKNGKPVYKESKPVLK